jgi:hypothetical protein
VTSSKERRRLVFAVMVRDVPIASTEEMFAVDGVEGAIAAAIPTGALTGCEKTRLKNGFGILTRAEIQEVICHLAKILFPEHVN